MNALLGLVHLDGRPAPREALQLMAAAAAPWGYEAGDPWFGDGAGIAGERIPVAGGSAIVFATGRLDNRDDLCAALGLDRGTAPAAAVMAAAYERWDEEAPRRILGDWAFAAYHPHERRLVLARDHYGQTGLYYHRDGGSLTFASSLKSLLALPRISKRMNELRVAQHLAAWPADGHQTIYEGISRLPPAHLLTAEAGATRTREYWHPRDAPDVRLPGDDAYLDRFVELLAEAVRVRLPAAGVAASTQSAGLDSSLVTAFAAREQLARGERLTVLTSVPADLDAAAALPDALTDEWPLAAQAVSGHTNVDHLRIDGAAITPMQAIARSHAIHDEPDWGIANLPWLLTMLETCRDRGERVLLTGQMGNAGVSWTGNEALTLARLRTGDARGALRAFAARRRGPDGTWALALRRELAGPARRRIEKELQRRTRRGGLAGARLVSPDLARRVDLEARMADAGFDTAHRRASAADLRLATLLPGVHTAGAGTSEKGRAYGLEMPDPTVDVRLLEFCFGVPEEQWVRGAQDRWLARRALRGLVPDAVRLNRRRGVQGADIAARLRADAPAVTEALERIAGSDPARSLIDTDRLQKAWTAVRTDPPHPAFLEGCLLARGLGIGLLLMRFE